MKNYVRKGLDDSFMILQFIKANMFQQNHLISLFLFVITVVVVVVIFIHLRWILNKLFTFNRIRGLEQKKNI